MTLPLPQLALQAVRFSIRPMTTGFHCLARCGFIPRASSSSPICRYDKPPFRSFFISAPTSLLADARRLPDRPARVDRARPVERFAVAG